MATLVSVAGGTPTWRRGVRAVLEDAGLGVASFDDFSEWQPGIGGSVVVVRGGEGISDAIHQTASAFPQVPIVVVDDHVTVAGFARWVRMGALGVVDDADEPEDLATIVEAALQDRSAIPKHVLKAMARHVPDDRDLSAWINDEEASWLTEMADGLTVLELAEDRGYSERAMFRMLRNVYDRIGARNRTEALLWAGRHGILG